MNALELFPEDFICFFKAKTLPSSKVLQTASEA